MRGKNSVHLHFHLHFCTDNWTGILFWFSCFSSINALTNCSGIVGLPLIIICSLVFWSFSSFSVYFRWHSCNLAFVCCLIFCICYALCYLAYILCSISLPIAFNLYSCLVFHSCGIQVKAWEELDESFIEPFISWLCKLPQPVDGFDNASAPGYIRRIISISCVNYVRGSDTSTHQQIDVNSAKTPPAQHKISRDSM